MKLENLKAIPLFVLPKLRMLTKPFKNARTRNPSLKDAKKIYT